MVGGKSARFFSCSLVARCVRAPFPWPDRRRLKRRPLESLTKQCQHSNKSCPHHHKTQYEIGAYLGPEPSVRCRLSTWRQSRKGRRSQPSSGRGCQAPCVSRRTGGTRRRRVRRKSFHIRMPRPAGGSLSNTSCLFLKGITVVGQGPSAVSATVCRDRRISRMQSTSFFSASLLPFHFYASEARSSGFLGGTRRFTSSPAVLPSPASSAERGRVESRHRITATFTLPGVVLSPHPSAPRESSRCRTGREQIRRSNLGSKGDSRVLGSEQARRMCHEVI